MESITALFTYTLLLIGNYVYGQNTGSVSNNYRLSITPPGITFSIWGVIYFGLFLVILKSFVTNSFKNGRLQIFIFSCILNVSWLLVFANTKIPLIFQYLILLMLYITLLVLYTTYIKDKYSFERKVFGLYLGWVSIAQIISLGIYLVKSVGVPEFLYNILAYLYLIITPIGFYSIFGLYPVIPYIWLAVAKLLF